MKAIILESFMWEDLGLSGNDLIVYAFIHQNSQGYPMNNELKKNCPVSPQVFSARYKHLMDAGLIEIDLNPFYPGIKTCHKPSSEKKQKHKSKSYKGWTEDEFKQSMRDANMQMSPKMSDEQLFSFARHWLQKDPRGNFGFQKQATWGTKARMENWLRRGW